MELIKTDGKLSKFKIAGQHPSVEGKSGYYETTWRWGKDLGIAEKCAEDKNRRLGLTDDDVTKIICSSSSIGKSPCYMGYRRGTGENVKALQTCFFS